MTENNDPTPPEERASGWQRAGWMLLIWTLSVLVLGGVALLLRALMGAVGFHD